MSILIFCTYISIIFMYEYLLKCNGNKVRILLQKVSHPLVIYWDGKGQGTPLMIRVITLKAQNKSTNVRPFARINYRIGFIWKTEHVYLGYDKVLLVLVFVSLYPIVKV